MTTLPWLFHLFIRLLTAWCHRTCDCVYAACRQMHSHVAFAMLLIRILCRDFQLEQHFQRNECFQGQKPHGGSPRPSVAFEAFRQGVSVSVSVYRCKLCFRHFHGRVTFDWSMWSALVQVFNMEKQFLEKRHQAVDIPSLSGLLEMVTPYPGAIVRCYDGMMACWNKLTLH